MTLKVNLNEIENVYRKAAEFLLKKQNRNGSWNYSSFISKEDSWTTSESLIVILYIKDDNYFCNDQIRKACDIAVDWLLKSQNIDGGWNCFYYSKDKESVTAGTAYAIIALDLYSKVFSVSNSINIAIKNALEWLIKTQNDDGGWSSLNKVEDRSHIGCTAFAVRAMNEHIKHNGVAEAIQRSVFYLTKYYDSGWKYSPLHEIDASLTNYVLKMLIELEANGRHNINKELIVTTIKTMLLTQHNDGTWSDWLGFFSSIEATSLFIENYSLIVNKTRFSKSQLKKAIQCIISEQKENASWGQEVGDVDESPYWITHNCIIAMKCIANHLKHYWPEYILKLQMEEKHLWKSRYRFDVVLSFAGEDREYVKQIYHLLKKRKVKVFYDNAFQSELWGEDLTEKLDTIYRTDTKYCMIFCSKYYPQKKWSVFERRSAKAAQFDTGRYDYILPILLDDTSIPGILKTSGYLDSRKHSPEEIVDLFIEKLKAFNEEKRF